MCVSEVKADRQGEGKVPIAFVRRSRTCMASYSSALIASSKSLCCSADSSCCVSWRWRWFCTHALVVRYSLLPVVSEEEEAWPGMKKPDDVDLLRPRSYYRPRQQVHDCSRPPVSRSFLLLQRQPCCNCSSSPSGRSNDIVPLSLETGLDAVELETFRLLLLSFLRALLEVDLGRDLRGDIYTQRAVCISRKTAGLSRRPHSVPQRAIAGSKATLSGATPGTDLTHEYCARRVIPFTRISDANLCVTGSGYRPCSSQCAVGPTSAYPCHD